MRVPHGGALVAVARPRVPGAGSIVAASGAELRERLESSAGDLGGRLRYAADCITHGLSHQRDVTVGGGGLELTPDLMIPPHAWVHAQVRGHWYRVLVMERGQ